MSNINFFLIEEAAQLAVQRALGHTVVPIYMTGVIVDFDGAVVDVQLDGDDDPIAAHDLTTGVKLRAGDRVMVTFAPPHQALIIGRIQDQYSAMSSVRLRKENGQTLGNAALTDVEFDTVEINDDNWWTSGSPTVFTVPFNGLANPVANCGWEANTTERRQLRITQNFASGGSRPIAVVRWDAVSSEPTPQSVNGGWVPVLAGDTFVVQARQDSGGGLVIGGATGGADNTNFSCLLLRM